MPRDDSTDPNAPGDAADLRHQRIRRIAIGAACAYALYALTLGLIVPWVAREPIEREVGALLGVELDIDRIRVNPLTLRFEIGGIELRDASGNLLVSADSLVANLEFWQSLLGVLRVSEIVLEAPAVHGELSADGELNLLALLPDDADATDAPDDGDDTGLFPVRIDQLHIRDGSLRLFDRSQDHLFIASLRPIDLSVAEISTVPGEQGRVRFEATSSRGLHLLTEFELSVDPLAATGTLSLDGLRFNTVADYLGPSFPVRPTDGELEIETDFGIDLDADGGLVVRVDRGGIEARDWRADSDLAELQRVGLDRFAVEGFRLSVADREIGIDEIVLEGPSVAAVLPGVEDEGASTSEADEAADPQAASPDVEPADSVAADASAAPPGAETPEWKIEVDRLVISDGTLSLASAEARDEAIISVGPIDLEALGISSVANEDIEISLSVALPDPDLAQLAPPPGGEPVDAANPTAASAATSPKRESTAGAHIQLTGRVVPRPLEADLEVTAKDVALAPWSPLVGFAPGTRISSGRLDVTSSVEASMPDGAEQPEVSASAAVDVRGLVIEQPRGGRNAPTPVIRVGRLHVEQLRVDDSGQRVDLKTVQLDAPSIFVERTPNGGLNVNRLMAPTPDAAPGPSPGPSFDLRRIEIADGRLDYRDASTKRAFNLDISQLNGVYERVEQPGGTARGELAFDARVGESAPLTVRGGFPSAEQVDFQLALQGLSVTLLAPYFEQYVGNEVEQGKMNVDLDYSVFMDTSRISGKNKLRFDRLAFGPRTGSEDALRLPVPLAFKLLTDRQGQTDLDLGRIEGDLDDPNFNLRALITAAFVKVIQQALSSPFAVLQTAMPDFTADKQTQIDFAVGSSSLDEAQRQTLVNVATLIANQPKQRIGIKGRVDKRRDERALRKAGEDVDDERLLALGKARARAVRAELVDELGLDEALIFIRSVDLDGQAEDDFVAVDVVLTDD